MTTRGHAAKKKQSNKTQYTRISIRHAFPDCQAKGEYVRSVNTVRHPSGSYVRSPLLSLEVATAENKYSYHTSTTSLVVAMVTYLTLTHEGDSTRHRNTHEDPSRRKTGIPYYCPVYQKIKHDDGCSRDGVRGVCGFQCAVLLPFFMTASSTQSVSSPLVDALSPSSFIVESNLLPAHSHCRRLPCGRPPSAPGHPDRALLLGRCCLTTRES